MEICTKQIILICFDCIYCYTKYAITVYVVQYIFVIYLLYNLILLDKNIFCGNFLDFYFLGGGGLKFAVNCKKRFRRGRFFCFKLLQRCAYTKTFCTKFRRGRISLPVLNAAVYGIMRNLIEIVFLLCFQNLLVYGLALFALFSKFALLTLANFEKG